MGIGLSNLSMSMPSPQPMFRAAQGRNKVPNNSYLFFAAAVIPSHSPLFESKTLFYSGGQRERERERERESVCMNVCVCVCVMENVFVLKFSMRVYLFRPNEIPSDKLGFGLRDCIGKVSRILSHFFLLEMVK